MGCVVQFSPGRVLTGRRNTDIIFSININLIVHGQTITLRTFALSQILFGTVHKIYICKGKRAIKSNWYPTKRIKYKHDYFRSMKIAIARNEDWFNSLYQTEKLLMRIHYAFTVRCLLIIRQIQENCCTVQ